MMTPNSKKYKLPKLEDFHKKNDEEIVKTLICAGFKFPKDEYKIYTYERSINLKGNQYNIIIRNDSIHIAKNNNGISQYLHNSFGPAVIMWGTVLIEYHYIENKFMTKEEFMKYRMKNRINNVKS